MEAIYDGHNVSCGYLLATVRAWYFQALPFLMDFKWGLVLILCKAYKLDYCLNKPSAKRRTQTFTRSLFNRILPDVTK